MGMFCLTISLSIQAATGAVQSSLYLDCGLSAPTFSMLSFYLPLCIICTLRLLKQSKQSYSTPSTEDQTEQSNQANDEDNELQLKLTNSDESFQEHGGVVPTTSNEEEDDPKIKIKPFSLCRIVPLQTSPWKYAGVAIADVYANYTTILAFKYTTITSVSLFDALAIPSAMLVSRLFFGRRYTKVHLFAVFVCCIGISINIFQDYREDRLRESGEVIETAQEELVQEEYPYKVAGDALAITGGILFGVSNTLAEIAVRDWGTQDEFISAMAFFASIITFLQTVFTERQEVKAFFSTSSDSCSELGSLTLMAVFVIATVVNYLGIASFLEMSDAAFLNLSLLTGDAWAVAFSVFAEGIVPSATFYFALCITVSGVFIYETAPDVHLHASDKEENEIEMRSNKATSDHVLT
jgi:solute carrier family 35 protein F1/2